MAKKFNAYTPPGFQVDLGPVKTGKPVPPTVPANPPQTPAELLAELDAPAIAALRRGARSEIGMIGTDRATGEFLVHLGFASWSQAGDLYITDPGRKVATGN